MSLTLTALAERLAPKPVDVFALFEYVPTPRQAEFHAATEWDVLYGGAAGGGKTRALLMHAIRACQQYPGLKVAAFRRTYPELEESLLAELEAIGYADKLGCTYNQSKHDLRFPNGSIIRFRYAETVKDATRRQGSEIQLLLVDERTQVPSSVVDYLATRLRSSNPSIPVLGIRSGTNPGGIGHGAVKQSHIVPTGYGAHTYCDHRGRVRRFIPAKVTDNPHLNPEYEQDLAAITDDALRAALKDGSWDTFAGQFFTEWNHDRHVIRPFAVPDTWPRLTGTDFGFAAPWCTLWAAVDADRRVWVYREVYKTQVGEREQARSILDAEGSLSQQGGLRALEKGETIRIRVGDPSMWAKSGDANPIADTYALNGVPLSKANNDRLTGWQRVHTYLAERPACSHHRQLGWITCPGIHVFDTCPDLIRTLPDLPHDMTKVEDVDTDAEDHAADALRYLLMALPEQRLGNEQSRAAVSVEERAYEQMQKRATKRSHGRQVGS